MKIVESILTNNPCYKAGRKITVKGLMLHSVGCPQPSAVAFVNSWNEVGFDGDVCVHAFIDANDGTVYKTLPWNHRGWHCGAGANNTHIGVELCEPDCIEYTGGSSFTCSDIKKAKEMVKRTYVAAVELFAYLCKEFNLNPLADGVIISHAEGYKRGIASNHGDPEHLWNQLGMGYTMNTFRQAVKAAMTQDDTAPKPYTLELPQLYKGCKGELVEAVQAILIHRGYSCGGSGVDGSFGPATDKAVRAFQSDCELDPDGYVGRNTMRALLGL